MTGGTALVVPVDAAWMRSAARSCGVVMPFIKPLNLTGIVFVAFDVWFCPPPLAPIISSLNLADVLSIRYVDGIQVMPSGPEIVAIYGELSSGRSNS